MPDTARHQAGADHAVAHQDDCGKYRIPRQRLTRPARQHDGHDQHNLNHRDGDGDGEDEGSEGFADTVRDRLGMEHGGEHGGDQGSRDGDGQGHAETE